MQIETTNKVSWGPWQRIISSDEWLTVLETKHPRWHTMSTSSKIQYFQNCVNTLEAGGGNSKFMRGVLVLAMQKYTKSYLPIIDDIETYIP